jgi:hypothetical protein
MYENMRTPDNHIVYSQGRLLKSLRASPLVDSFLAPVSLCLHKCRMKSSRALRTQRRWKCFKKCGRFLCPLWSAVCPWGCLSSQSPHVFPRGGGPPRRSPQVAPTGDPHSRSEDALPERKLSLLCCYRFLVGCFFWRAPRGINKRNFPFE